MEETIRVIGLGHIGLPLALCLCERGFRVIGVDSNVHKVEELSRGRTTVAETYRGESLQSILQRHLLHGRFVPTTDPELGAGQARTHMVTVGIPVSAEGIPDIDPLRRAIDALSRVVQRGDLVMVRSTLVPGMMEDVIIPALAAGSRLVPGTDFHVAYAPERVAEGRAFEEFQTLDVVVAGLTPACAAAAKAVLGRLTSGALHETDLRTAQLSKVVENVQRDVNIALAQQIREIAEAHGVDVFELIRIANTHPRVHLLEPGLGVGGYCIPNAYPYVAASVAEPLPLLKLARRINEMVPLRMVERLAKVLAALGRRLDESTVAILGLGMKDGSNDVRQSPAIECAKALVARGALVRAYDPTVPVSFAYQVTSPRACLHEADAVIVAAWQPEFDSIDWREVLALCRRPLVVIDLKQRLRRHLPVDTLPPRTDLVPGITVVGEDLATAAGGGA